MNFKHTFIDSHFSKEIQGGALGIFVALVLYSVLSALPSSQVTKGLLVDTVSTPTSETVRVNDKTADADTLRRLAARTAQIAVQKSQTSSSAVTASITSSASSTSVEQVVANHADRTAWIAMRQKQRDLASAFDLSLQHAASPILAEPAKAQAATVKTATRRESRISMQGTVANTDATLPNSGPVMNVVILSSLALAAMIRKRSSIATLLQAS